jgi:hypothetical protein
MNRVRDNRATEYVVEPQCPGLHIEGYGLLYEGRPLLVDDESISGEYGCSYQDHYVLNTTTGMPYLVDLHAMRYYLAMHSLSRGTHPNYQPVDRYGDLVHKASPCHMTVSVTVGATFSLRVTTKLLSAPIQPYKVLPYDCLDDTVSGPTEGTIIKVLNWAPKDLIPGNEYVYDGGHDVDIYMGPASVGEVANYYRGGHYIYQIFRREGRYPVFYESIDMTSILALQRGI